MIALPVASPGKSPFKVEQQILPRQIGTPTQQTVVSAGTPMVITSTLILPHPSLIKTKLQQILGQLSHLFLR